MSEAVDERVRELVKNSSIETREAVFEDLLRELMRVEPDAKSIPLQAADGELLGLYVRPAPVGPAPERTPEEEEEYQRRVATIEDIIDGEELIRRVTERIRAKSHAR